MTLTLTNHQLKDQITANHKPRTLVVFRQCGDAHRLTAFPHRHLGGSTKKYLLATSAVRPVRMPRIILLRVTRLMSNDKVKEITPLADRIWNLHLMDWLQSCWHTLPLASPNLSCVTFRIA